MMKNWRLSKTQKASSSGLNNINNAFMIADKNLIQEYPFDGAFYRLEKDMSKPPSQQKTEEVLAFETKCDIQEAQKSDSSGVFTSTYNVYFPFDKEKGVGVEKGMIFKGSMYGVKVEGEIFGLFPTQLGCCAVYLKDRKV